MSAVEAIQGSDPYRAVSALYEGKRAKRSGIDYLRHIHEGLAVLEAIGASEDAMKGFCLHPLFQDDGLLIDEGSAYALGASEARPVMLAMEYRRVANAYLSKAEMPAGGIGLSPLKEVNDMLIADKAQNRKDFQIAHLGSHPNSERLDCYFKEWLEALGVDERRYAQLVAVMSLVP